MRLTFLLVALAFVLGAGIGDRYGLPGFTRAAADAGFSAVERWVGQGSGSEGAPKTETPNDALSINEAGLDIIRGSEGLRLDAYWSGSQWLIGYGHSRTAREGMTITEAEADALLRADIAGSEDDVRRIVTVALNRNQFSALVSLAYNLGGGGFSRTEVVKRLNAGDYAGAADAFLLHDRVRIDGELRSAPHLTERRKKERALFLN